MPNGTAINFEHRAAPATWRYMTLSQVSQKLGGRSRSSLYRDIEAGRLPNPISLVVDATSEKRKSTKPWHELSAEVSEFYSTASP